MRSDSKAPGTTKKIGVGSRTEATPFDRIYVYGARDRIHYSGVPYYLMLGLRDVLDEGSGSKVQPIPLKRTREIPISYLSWCLKNRSLDQSAFFYSRDYHEASVRGASINVSKQTVVISFPDPVAPSVLQTMEKANCDRLYLYRDATFMQLLDDFKYARSIKGRERDRLIETETALYDRARHIFVFDAVNKDYLVNRYGVSEQKVSVAGRGLNMSRAEFESALAMRNEHDALSRDSIVFTIVGRDARRKGVFRIVEAMDALSDGERKRIRLQIVGPDPSSIPKRSYIDALGFVSDTNAVLEIIAGTDVGVLMSSAEGGVPASLGEFTCLGIPCWVAWLPQFDGGLDERLVFKEPLPLTTAGMTHTLQQIMSYSPLDLSAKGKPGLGYVGWIEQAQIVYRKLLEDL